MNRPSGPLLRSLLWLVLWAAGWGFGALVLQPPPVRAAAQIPAFALLLGAVAALAAAPVALAGAFCRAGSLRRPLYWALAALLGLPLGVSLGYLANVLLLLRQARAMGMALAADGGGATLVPSAPLVLVLAGAALGLATLPTLRENLLAGGARKAFWVLGLAAALGFGWLVSTAVSAGVGVAFSRGALMGAVSGLAALGLLVALEAGVSEGAAA